MTGPFTEQALVLETPPGLVVITGCAHPGIVRMLEVVKAQYDRPIYMVLGGFHLVTAPADEIAAIVQRFRALGVRKVGATHCTGDTAIAAFRRVYGDDYVPMGVGRVITVNH